MFGYAGQSSKGSLHQKESPHQKKGPHEAGPSNKLPSADRDQAVLL
jgi:hypothetical protein